MKAGQTGSIAAPVMTLVVVLGLWEGAVRAFDILPIILPSPTAVGAALWDMRSDLLTAAFRTGLATCIALGLSVVTGLLFAALFSRSETIRRSLYPYAVLLQTIPIVAMAPILINLAGRGLFSITLVAWVISLFPVLTNTTTGLLQTDPRLVELFRLYTNSWLRTFLKLRFPSALPYLISGVRIGSGTAMVGAIVGEFFVGSGEPGLGYLIQSRADAINPAPLYATVVVSAALGTTFFAVITLSGEWILRRWFGMTLAEKRA